MNIVIDGNQQKIDQTLYNEHAFVAINVPSMFSAPASSSKDMEQTRHQVFKSVLNVILFTIIFISFLVLYFINETNDYLKARTIIASSTEEVDKYSLPVLVICFEPSYKPSIYGNGSADISYSIFKKEYSTKEKRLDDFLQFASYKLNEDIQIELKVYDDNTTVKHYLEEGQQVMDNFQIDVYQTQTLSYGLCYVIESGEKIGPGAHLLWL